MNETLKRLGEGLRNFFAGEIRRPLNWRIIDAIETLKEKEVDETLSDRIQPKPEESSPPKSAS